MYTPDDIQKRLRQKPFQPLRFVCSEGLRFDIHHPDLVLVGSRDVTIGFPRSDNPSIYDQQTRVAILHIVALEDIPSKASAKEGAA